MSETFFCDPDDCIWLLETHLRDVPLPVEWQAFKSFTITGNEDTPEEIRLYRSADPEVGDASWLIRMSQVTGEYVGAWQV